MFITTTMSSFNGKFKVTLFQDKISEMNISLLDNHLHTGTISYAPQMFNIV